MEKIEVNKADFDGIRYINKNLDIVKADGQKWEILPRMYQLVDKKGHILLRCRKSSVIVFSVQ